MECIGSMLPSFASLSLNHDADPIGMMNRKHHDDAKDKLRAAFKKTSGRGTITTRNAIEGARGASLLQGGNDVPYAGRVADLRPQGAEPSSPAGRRPRDEELQRALDLARVLPPHPIVGFTKAASLDAANQKFNGYYVITDPPGPDKFVLETILKRHLGSDQLGRFISKMIRDMKPAPIPRGALPERRVQPGTYEHLAHYAHECRLCGKDRPWDDFSSEEQRQLGQGRAARCLNCAHVREGTDPVADSDDD